MHTDPELINRFHEGVLLLVWDNTGGVPTGAPAEHVEDYMLMDEYRITLDFFVELVWYLHTADVVGPRFDPFTADLTRLNDVGD